MSERPTTRVVYTKYDGSLHWNHPAQPLGEDAHGVWLGCPIGTRMRRGTEPPVVRGQPFVMLFPRDAWWTACFNAAPDRTEIYCDITTVPVFTDAGTVTMVDLDLDVIRKRNGKLYLDDEDEFEEHQVRYGYPPEVITAARASADWLLTAVGGRAEPFGTACEEWLARMR